jgi:hypothetical protein
VRVRGEVEWRGARLLLLMQSRRQHTTANYEDLSQWTCLGARWDLQHYYGCGALPAGRIELDTVQIDY